MNILKKVSLTGEKQWVSTNDGHSWIVSDNAIIGGDDSWALKPLRPGECMTLGRRGEPTDCYSF